MISEQLQQELIGKACKEVGLDGHCRLIEQRQDAYTWAENIAERFRNYRNMPIKNSYMYCDTLDMCFFYTDNGKAAVAYAGYAFSTSADIMGGKIIKAFQLAEQLLNAMDRLIDERENRL